MQKSNYPAAETKGPGHRHLQGQSGSAASPPSALRYNLILYVHRRLITAKQGQKSGGFCTIPVFGVIIPDSSHINVCFYCSLSPNDSECLVPESFYIWCSNQSLSERFFPRKMCRCTRPMWFTPNKQGLTDEIHSVECIPPSRQSPFLCSLIFFPSRSKHCSQRNYGKCQK